MKTSRASCTHTPRCRRSCTKRRSPTLKSTEPAITKYASSQSWTCGGGPESSGKTTLTLQTIAQCQKAGGTAAFVDAEHALDPNYAQKLGVNLDDLLISQPDTGEQGLEIADMLVRSGGVDIIVITGTGRAFATGGDLHEVLPAISAELRKRGIPVFGGAAAAQRVFEGAESGKPHPQQDGRQQGDGDAGGQQLGAGGLDEDRAGRPVKRFVSAVWRAASLFSAARCTALVTSIHTA